MDKDNLDMVLSYVDGIDWDMAILLEKKLTEEEKERVGEIFKFHKDNIIKHFKYESKEV